MVLVILATAAALLGGGQILRPSPDFYPEKALRSREEGEVKLRIVGGPDATLSCAIVSRSSSPELDDASCPLIVARLRALAWRGMKPLSVKVGWRIPIGGVSLDYGGAIPFDPSLWVRAVDIPVTSTTTRVDGKTSVTFAIGVDGSVSDCQIVASSGVDQLDRKLCLLVTNRAAFLPALAPDGSARPTRGRTTITWFTSP